MKNFMFVIVLLFSSKSFSMVCLDSNNSTTNTVSIDAPVLVSEAAAIGDVIWASPEMTTAVSCYINPSEERDFVYVWPFPYFDYSTLPSGISMRLIINGETIDPASVERQLLTPESEWVIPSEGRSGIVTSQLVLIKSGNIIENKELGNIPLYQLDGQSGLNGSNSLRVSLSGLKNIVGVQCTSELDIGEKNSSLTINDDLINNGKTTGIIANVSVACTPSSAVGNKTLHLSVLPSEFNVSEGGLFKTNREGLLYSLTIGGRLINANTTDNNISLTLDSSGKGSMPVYQNFTLANSTASWLYDDSLNAVESNTLKINTKVKRIE